MSICILHGREETRSAKKENKLTLQQAEMRLIRWMCGIKVTDMFTYSYVRETRNRRYNYSGTATQVKMIWACFKKGRK